MSVLWERFAGQTDRFAIRLAIMPDPHAGAGASAAESMSWGALQIWVHGQNLCAHTDQGEMLAGAHWYLLPLLDWVSRNWNPLLHEEKLPNLNSGETAADGLFATRLPPPFASDPEMERWETEWFDWRSRHALRTARSGGLFPNVVIRRVRDYVEVSWNSEQDAGAPPGFGFIATLGSALFHPGDVAGPLHDVVVAAARFIEQSGVDPAGASALLGRLDLVAASDRQHEDRLKWMTGLRSLPGAVDDDRWDLLVRSLRRDASPEAFDAALESDDTDLVITGSSPAALLFGSVSPTVSSDDVRTLSSVLIEQFRDGVQPHPLDRLAEDAPFDSRVPAWEQGYELAEDLHENLGLDFSPGWIDVEDVVRALGIQVVERELMDPGLRACSLVGPHHRPTVVQNVLSQFGSSPARRFTLAHELCHLLYDRGRGAKVAIASGPWAPRGIERRANAFAAMFLMPEDLVRSHVGSLETSVADGDTVSRLASTLRVSRRAVIEHLYNLALMSESEREELLGRAVE